MQNEELRVMYTYYYLCYSLVVVVHREGVTVPLSSHRAQEDRDSRVGLTTISSTVRKNDQHSRIGYGMVHAFLLVTRVL